MLCGRATEATKRLIHTQRVAHIRRGCTPLICTSQTAVPTPDRLPASTGHAAQPSRRHEQRPTRRPAGRRSPTKSTLSTASIDASPAANTLRTTPESMLAAPRPAARRRPAAAPPSPRSRPRKRHRNSPPSADRHRRLRPPAPDTPSKLDSKPL